MEEGGGEGVDAAKVAILCRIGQAGSPDTLVLMHRHFLFRFLWMLQLLIHATPVRVTNARNCSDRGRSGGTDEARNEVMIR